MLNMPKYALIMLNTIEYAGIYLKKKNKSVEYARIVLNTSDAVRTIRSLYSLLNSY